jgi:hypothetical protein
VYYDNLFLVESNNIIFSHDPEKPHFFYLSAASLLCSNQPLGQGFFKRFNLLKFIQLDKSYRSTSTCGTVVAPPLAQDRHTCHVERPSVSRSNHISYSYVRFHAQCQPEQKSLPVKTVVTAFLLCCCWCFLGPRTWNYSTTRIRIIMQKWTTGDEVAGTVRPLSLNNVVAFMESSLPNVTFSTICFFKRFSQESA